MIEKLACKLGRSDEAPNIALAQELCQNRDANGIQEIVAGLHGKDKAVAGDCIKVLYEIGKREPALVCAYTEDFLACLRAKNNRLVWGGMTALAQIAACAPGPVFEGIDTVISAYKTGSVITVDNSVSVFAGLCKAGGDYAKTVLPILLAHLQTCRPKEVAQHAERASVCFNGQNTGAFAAVLEKRLPDLTPPQQTRVTALLKRFAALQY